MAGKMAGGNCDVDESAVELRHSYKLSMAFVLFATVTYNKYVGSNLVILSEVVVWSY
jgi:hypothetical protein